MLRDPENPKQGNNKLLTKQQRSHMSDSTKADFSPSPRVRKSLIDFPYVDDYVVAPYRVYFEVTTEQVIERIKESIYPFNKNPLFLDANIDLYGPLWIYFTLNT